MRPAFLTISLALLLIGGASPSLSHAFTAANTDSKIDINAIDIAPKKTPIPTRKSKPQPTPRIIQPERQATSITQGDRLLPTKRFFTFSLSSLAVDFGTIDATNPVIRTHKLTLNPGSAKSYTLLAYQNHPLRIDEDEQSFIPDTTCDDGNCTERTASVWQNTLTYGLGFRCDEEETNEQCMSEFTNQQFYKQFADLSRKESGATILKGDANEPFESRVTYKVNVPGTQKAGLYTNALVLIAAPGY